MLARPGGRVRMVDRQPPGSQATLRHYACAPPVARTQTLRSEWHLQRRNGYRGPSRSRSRRRTSRVLPTMYSRHCASNSAKTGDRSVTSPTTSPTDGHCPGPPDSAERSPNPGALSLVQVGPALADRRKMTVARDSGAEQSAAGGRIPTDRGQYDRTNPGSRIIAGRPVATLLPERWRPTDPRWSQRFPISRRGSGSPSTRLSGASVSVIKRRGCRWS
jgi:hypothetical protein